MDLRLFIDEVGNGDLNGAAYDPNVRYLGLTGVMAFKQAHEQHIQPVLDDMKALFFGHSSENPVVLLRREIVRRERPFEVLRDPETEAEFSRTMLRLYEKLPYLVMSVVIDKKAHLERYGVWHFDPYHYCLRCLVERYVNYLDRHGRKGDVVIEARYPKADKKLKASFRRIYETGTEHLPSTMVLKCLLSHDIKFYSKSANVAGLQIADLLAHPSTRSIRHEQLGLTQPDDFGSKVVQVLLDKKYARNPRTNRIDGWGRKWLP